jgi:hypothetical protein
MAEDKAARNYWETMPYGKDAKASEIHGKAAQVSINEQITEWVHGFDQAKEAGDKKKASMFNGLIKATAVDVENLQGRKEEYAMISGGGVNGKSQFSNFYDQTWDKLFFTEQGQIGFAPEDQGLVMSVMLDNGEVVTKRNKDIGVDWVTRGTEETDFMKMQQDAVKQSNSIGTPLDFDVDWAMDRLLGDGDSWKVMLSDKIGGKYFLHDYLEENQEAIASGELTDEMLAPESFNPEFDTRLFKHYAGRIKRSFDPDFQTAREAKQADELIARNNIA